MKVDGQEAQQSRRRRTRVDRRLERRAREADQSRRRRASRRRGRRAWAWPWMPIVNSCWKQSCRAAGGPVDRSLLGIRKKPTRDRSRPARLECESRGKQAADRSYDTAKKVIVAVFKCRLARLPSSPLVPSTSWYDWYLVWLTPIGRLCSCLTNWAPNNIGCLINWALNNIGTSLALLPRATRWSD